MNASFPFACVAMWSLFAMATTVRGQGPANDADVNRDGVVSQAEAEYSNSLRLRFDELDRNRDGRLDPSEVTGLMPAPPGAVPTLPQSAIGRAPGTVTPPSGTAGATAATHGAAMGRATVPGASAGAPPGASAVPGSIGPASGSPFGSPFNSSGSIGGAGTP